MLNEYQQVVERHRHRVYSFAHYSLRAREDAEDVTQEVFIKLWQHWRKIDQEKIGGWLMRVAHNAVIDKVRKGKSSKNGDSQQDAYAEVEDQGQVDDPGAEIDREEFRLQLQRAIQGLEEPFRSIVILRDIQGLSYVDIQECLGMSESQVKVYLHRSRRKLRENAELRALFESARNRSTASNKNQESNDSAESAANTE